MLDFIWYLINLGGRDELQRRRMKGGLEVQKKHDTSKGKGVRMFNAYTRRWNWEHHEDVGQK